MRIISNKRTPSENFRMSPSILHFAAKIFRTGYYDSRLGSYFLYFYDKLNWISRSFRHKKVDSNWSLSKWWKSSSTTPRWNRFIYLFAKVIFFATSSYTLIELTFLKAKISYDKRKKWKWEKVNFKVTDVKWFFSKKVRNFEVRIRKDSLQT